MKPNSLDHVEIMQIKHVFQEQVRSSTGPGPWHKKNEVSPQRRADRRRLLAGVLSQIPMIVGQITRLLAVWSPDASLFFVSSDSIHWLSSSLLFSSH